MSDALLQDLWFHQTDGIAIDSIDTDDESVVIRARTQTSQSAGATSDMSYLLKAGNDDNCPTGRGPKQPRRKCRTRPAYCRRRIAPGAG
ncbi:hypothetical protein GCM10010507_60150 [Streptomyces cinnamoneus]|uniref:Uncharacterized protein n=1 Tax=Streptomyces cinnamoneus TaxID=53446 RepID=A0A918U3L1_STRCJ|nr:hypothetical protein GCM10010507_60150 [Streptomyces cinnamoneus]